MFRVSILAIGSEILDGRVQDTNSSFIASRLSDLGIKPARFCVCDDDENEICACLDELAGVSDFIIVTGGLGPTTDDVTREAVAAFSGSGLSFCAEEFARLEAFFARRNRPLTANHNRQARVPDGSVLILNPVGTASGFFLEAPQKKVMLAVLPGVPKELYPMFERDVVPMMLKLASEQGRVHVRAFRVFGLGESQVGERIEDIKLPGDIVVSYRAMFPEVQVKLKAESEEILDKWRERVREAIGGEHIFSEDLSVSLEQTVHDLLIRLKRTISVAESCTGGMLGMMLTSMSGSSAYFRGGVLAYSNDLKTNLLGVDSETLMRVGAVSAETAEQMAVGVRLRLGSDMGISITGIAGPDGGSDEKPVGTVFIGLATDSGVVTGKIFFPSDRERVRRHAAYTALDMMRKALAGFSHGAQ